MADLRIFDPTVGMLKKVLDLRQQNQELIAANIANAETPGYVPAHLQFAKNLQRALATTGANAATRNAKEEQALEQVKGTVVRERPNGTIGDANGVQLDEEMSELAENQLLYEAAVTMMNKKLGLLKYVANDGR